MNLDIYLSINFTFKIRRIQNKVDFNCTTTNIFFSSLSLIHLMEFQGKPTTTTRSPFLEKYIRINCTRTLTQLGRYSFFPRLVIITYPIYYLPMCCHCCEEVHLCLTRSRSDSKIYFVTSMYLSSSLGDLTFYWLEPWRQ